MLRRIVTVVAPLAVAVVFVACSQDNNDRRPVEGNPGATTNQSSGYDSSDPAHYHPQSDDTKQYHPADSATIQPK